MRRQQKAPSFAPPIFGKRNTASSHVTVGKLATEMLPATSIQPYSNHLLFAQLSRPPWNGAPKLPYLHNSDSAHARQHHSMNMSPMTTYYTPRAVSTAVKTSRMLETLQCPPIRCLLSRARDNVTLSEKNATPHIVAACTGR